VGSVNTGAVVSTGGGVHAAAINAMDATTNTSAVRRCNMVAPSSLDEASPRRGESMGWSPDPVNGLDDAGQA